MDTAWRDGRATSAVLKAALDARHRVRPPKEHAVSGIRCEGKRLAVKTEPDGTVPLEVQAGREYELTFRWAGRDQCLSFHSRRVYFSAASRAVASRGQSVCGSVASQAVTSAWRIALAGSGRLVRKDRCVRPSR